MKSGYTHISVVLDRSGSMQLIKADTIGGFNAFLTSQKETPGEATLSLTQFNTGCTLTHSFINLAEVPELTTETYRPGGGTALYDAIGLTVRGCGEKLAALPEEARPEKVIVVIITDGEENSSSIYNYGQTKEMIQHQTEVYSWEFVFLGANLDAEVVGASFGIKAGNSMTFAANREGAAAMFTSVGSKMSFYRSASKDVVSATGYAFFDQDDRDKQSGALNATC